MSKRAGMCWVSMRARLETLTALISSLDGLRNVYNLLDYDV